MSVNWKIESSLKSPEKERQNPVLAPNPGGGVLSEEGQLLRA